MTELGKFSREELAQIVDWARQYSGTSADRLLLGSSDVPKVYRPAVARQLALGASLAQKLPSWAQTGVYIPEGINLEQATSELCARYKQRYISPEDTLVDMTGGLGVDFWALASMARRGIYIEQIEQTHQAAELNLPSLLPKGLDFTLLCGEALSLLPRIIEQYAPTIIYIDPARRAEGQSGQRVYAIEDCSPSLHEVLSILRELTPQPTPRLLVKLSPMLDIKHTLIHLPGIVGIDIIAARGEVKELLLHVELGTLLIAEDVPLRTVDLHPSGTAHSWSGCLGAEARSTCPLALAPKRYLYEPSSAVMKSGLFKLVGSDFSLEKFAQHTHLYTSDKLAEDFPGKVYEIFEAQPFSSSLIKQLSKRLDRAMVATRNFPLPTEALRQKLRIKDGGQDVIWGARLGKDEPWLFLCKRIATS